MNRFIIAIAVFQLILILLLGPPFATISISPHQQHFYLCRLLECPLLNRYYGPSLFSSQDSLRLLESPFSKFHLREELPVHRRFVKKTNHVSLLFPPSTAHPFPSFVVISLLLTDSCEARFSFRETDEELWCIAPVCYFRLRGVHSKKRI